MEPTPEQVALQVELFLMMHIPVLAREVLVSGKWAEEHRN